MAGKRRKRARRNTKKRVDGVMFPRRVVGFVIAVAFAALSYLWLYTRCDALGKELKVLEKEQTQLERKYLNEEYRWMRMKSPQNLERTLARYGIDMTWPRRDQVVWLADAGSVVDISRENGGFDRGRERVAESHRRGSRYD